MVKDQVSPFFGLARVKNSLLRTQTLSYPSIGHCLLLLTFKSQTLNLHDKAKILG